MMSAAEIAATVRAVRAARRGAEPGPLVALTDLVRAYLAALDRGDEDAADAALADLRDAVDAPIDWALVERRNRTAVTDLRRAGEHSAPAPGWEQRVEAAVAARPSWWRRVLSWRRGRS